MISATKQKRLLAFAAAILLAAILAFLGWLILREEAVLAEGATVSFRVVPRDPYDPLRGRYLALRLEVDEAIGKALVAVPEEQRGDPVFVRLEVGADGVAGFGGIVHVRPDAGIYLEVDPAARAPLGFDRYYVNEPIGPEADRLLRQAGERDIRLIVRIRDGSGTLAGLEVDGQPIEEAAAATPEA